MIHGKTFRFLTLMLSLCVLLSSYFTAGAATHRALSGNSTLVFEDADAIDSAVAGKIVAVFKAVYAPMKQKYNPDAPQVVYCDVDPDYDGVAYTIGDHVVVSADWLNSHPDDVDCLTHEFFHVVQSYPTGEPLWLIEGMTDYARYLYGVYNAEAGWSLPDYDAGQSYTDSYRVTARFLLWAETYVNPNLTLELDDLLHSNTYTADAWVTLTGKTVDALWAEYAANPDITRMVGDIDLDGSRTVSDVVELRGLILAGNTGRKDDVDYDGICTVSDVVALRGLILAGS